MTKIMQRAKGKGDVNKGITDLVKAGFPKQLAEELLKDGGRSQ